MTDPRHVPRRASKTWRTLLVVVESPFAGDIERNLSYARAAVKDSLLRGESPFASHLIYTQPGILDDSDPEERKLGIEAGLQWSLVADLTAFYVDLGWSPGMLNAREFLERHNRRYVERKLYQKGGRRCDSKSSASIGKSKSNTLSSI